MKSVPVFRDAFIEPIVFIGGDETIDVKETEGEKGRKNERESDSGRETPVAEKRDGHKGVHSWNR